MLQNLVVSKTLDNVGSSRHFGQGQNIPADKEAPFSYPPRLFGVQKLGKTRQKLIAKTKSQLNSRIYRCQKVCFSIMELRRVQLRSVFLIKLGRCFSPSFDIYLTSARSSVLTNFDFGAFINYVDKQGRGVGVIQMSTILHKLM